MTTPNNNNNNNSQMHNDMMAAGSKDRPPMLATRRYAQWQSCFMRYVDTKPNMKELKKCILNGPYVMTRILVPAKPAIEIDPPVPEHTVQETYENTLLKNHAYIDAEAKEIHMILSGIRDEIYSKVNACKTTQEMWTAIERLQQGRSLNKQDVKTNLFWEFGKFTSRDGESIESYYSRFYKMMNEMQEWSRFVTVVKQTIDLDKESYHKLFDILKQYQNEVNEICAEKIAMNANPLALVAVAQQNKNVDSTLRTENDRQTRQFGNQRTITVDGARETVGNQVVQQTVIKCFNCKEYGHFAKECKKPKWVKDYSYHKEKMTLCKQEEKGMPLSAE
ncbi:uncharacterized mitochondrial protein-like protein [Tanacetum coccineum]